MSRPRVVYAFSAGGVVYRRLSAGASEMSPGETSPDGPAPRFEVALVGHPAEETWVLPKGTPHPGETPEQTAEREVREETGIQPRIVGDLGSIDYWFTRKGMRYHKEVRHYLMEAVGGSVAEHDHEYAEARWFPIAEAIARLTHENEAAIARRAAQELARRFGATASDGRGGGTDGRPDATSV